MQTIALYRTFLKQQAFIYLKPTCSYKQMTLVRHFASKFKGMDICRKADFGHKRTENRQIKTERYFEFYLSRIAMVEKLERNIRHFVFTASLRIA